MPERVFLFDDQFFVAATVEAMLEGENLAFDYALEQRGALQKVLKFEPTVILLDFTMPGVDGLILLDLFKRHPLLEEVPVIMLSGHEDVEHKGEAFRRGASDYLVKLPHRTELLARIRYHSAEFTKKRDLRMELDRIRLAVGSG